VEIIPLLALNSLFPALLLSVLVLLLTRFNLLLRLLLAIVVLIVADAIISIATLFAFVQFELLPSKHTAAAMRHWLTVAYVARSIVFWIVGIFLILKSPAEKSKQFKLGIALILFVWELMFFFAEVPISSLFIGNPFWRFVSIGFYCLIALLVRRKTGSSWKLTSPS
jgi:hypothetical protein